MTQRDFKDNKVSSVPTAQSFIDRLYIYLRFGDALGTPNALQNAASR